VRGITMNIEKKPNPSLNQYIKSEEKEWVKLDEPGIEGVYTKTLKYDKEQNRSPSFLLKFEKGTHYPRHMHPAGEEIYVLDGSVKVGINKMEKGDYLYTAPGNVHDVFSENGCVLFLNVPEAVILI